MKAAEPAHSSSSSMLPLKKTTAPQPQYTGEPKEQTLGQFAITFGAMMVPFLGFCYGHQLGYFNAALVRIEKSRFGVYGFLGMPFITLSMEKCIYDTVQSLQGINPKVVPKDRGGFPSGGGALLPSFSLVPVMNYGDANDNETEEKSKIGK